MMRIKIWIQIAGIKLNVPVIKILLKQQAKSDEELSVWQLGKFDELISLGIPIGSLRDKELELFLEVETLCCCSVKKGSIRLFTEAGVLKSGLSPLIIGGHCDELIELERVLFKRKYKQVPSWHVQLMKERLNDLRREFCEGNPESLVINVVIPIPSYPLKLMMLQGKTNTSRSDDACTRDLNESQEDSKIKRNYYKIFSELNGSTISNGDLRALRGIPHRGFSSLPVDAANVLWTHREFLARKYPTGIVEFIQSIQWWLIESDPAEIEEALRVIESWKMPRDQGGKLEIAMMLMVTMGEINGICDSEKWINLFGRLIPDAKCKKEFMTKYASALIFFISRRATGMPKLTEYLRDKIMGSFGEEDVNLVSELYWRLKTQEDEGVFKEYQLRLQGSWNLTEIKKQERLFEMIEGVLLGAQKIKGSRAQKLEAIKEGLSDPESGVPSAAQQIPLLPGLQDTESGNRVTAIVPERSNLFKSTAFTVLLVFLRCQQSPTPTDTRQLSLPIIFKRGDDLRRDAACLRVFRAIWDIWCEEGGLQLFPRQLLYGVTALSDNFGMVEFVESVPLSRVLGLTGEALENNFEWAIHSYLRDLSPGGTRNFLTSCVGFSLLTYLFGIGDRHLDNLLVTPSGHLLHIDFSFLFGADPKPFPPPIKITREMVRAFDEDDPSHHDTDPWQEFKGLCFTALSLLRSKSGLILGLLRAEYPCDPESVNFVRDRLAGMISQADALNKLDKLLEESRRAMFPQVMETIHKWVQYWKS